MKIPYRCRKSNFLLQILLDILQVFFVGCAAMDVFAAVVEIVKAVGFYRISDSLDKS
ncbi:hypothetical protein MUP32_01495 [Candidatus Microgenomates bacterium]|nr:hypothetical protein [Candidatus Microgenomates bacterium]